MIDVDYFYKFENGFYGPKLSNNDLSLDLDKLIKDELIIMKIENGVWTYYITKMGIEKARTLSSGVSEEILLYLSEVVTWVNSLSFTSLVSSLTTAFPNYCEVDSELV